VIAKLVLNSKRSWVYDWFMVHLSNHSMGFMVDSPGTHRRRHRGRSSVAATPGTRQSESNMDELGVPIYSETSMYIHRYKLNQQPRCIYAYSCINNIKKKICKLFVQMDYYVYKYVLQTYSNNHDYTPSVTKGKRPTIVVYCRLAWCWHI